jgi:hypothetical protein
MLHHSWFVARATWIVGACVACAGSGEAPRAGAGAGGQDALPASGGGGTVSASAGNDAGGSGGSAGSVAGTVTPPGGAATGGTDGAAGSTGSAGRSEEGGAGANGGTAGQAGMAGAAPLPPDCGLSNPVSFKKDIEPYLTASCGKAKGGGCHVTDDSPTSGALCPDGTKTCGFDHAYDWITAGSHNEFCKQASTPLRFTVVLPVMTGAQPESCPKSRIMPPEGPPATACQLAAIQAWLAEPRVVQMHRSDDTSPTEPYGMPPFN